MSRLLTTRALAGLFLAAMLAGAPCAEAQSTEPIRLNQIGFYPDQPKTAVVVDAPEGTFFVRPAGGGEAVYVGTLGGARTWGPSGETVRVADFSGLGGEGAFVLEVPGVGASAPFRIAGAVHEGVARAALKAFYFQRASTPLTPEHAGPWARPAGHPDANVRVHPSAASAGRPAGTAVSAPYGWYDAGDYNKYVVNSGISTGTLLQLYEHFPAYFDALGTDIPESGNGVPDLLDEVLWNLRWLLAMQDPGDGGVYHKLTTANFAGAVMPHAATAQRYVVQKGTAATLNFAAVTALASRLYARYDPALADSMRTAAVRAWEWARAHPNVRYDQAAMNQVHTPAIHTGEYGDGSFGDEFDWAAMELYVTTRADSFLVATGPLSPIRMGLPWWGGVRELGYYSLLHHRETVAPDVDIAALSAQLLAAADRLLGHRAASAYGVVMGGEAWNFGWGSNSVAANQGVQLLQAHRLTGEARYLEGALANLDYLLGRNATGFSFVTGHGARTPRRPHHRPSEADGVAEPVPGLLVGGPNPGRQDVHTGGCAASDYPSPLPARAYTDRWCSYASNEVAINWNAPLAYLAGGIEASLSPTGLPTSSERPPQEGGGALSLVAYPNPARGSATLRFTLPAPGAVSARVLDVLGRTVRVLAEEAPHAAGTHELPLDGRGLPAGTYLVRLSAGGGEATRLLTLLGG